ncbi:MAG: hypothetical protein HQL54_11025 [Magnetococcales bacterium]|nr:hypothetical protein [Magnetococcales bacterium]
MIRSYIVMSGNGALLVITKLSCGMQGDTCRAQLREKGMERYIAFEIPTARVEERYGAGYFTVVNRMTGDDDIRVVDINGQRVMNNFNFAEMGEPVFVGDDEA